MPSTARISPAHEAAALLADVQRRALRGIVWAILGYLPIQLALWHSSPVITRTPISLAFEVTLLAGIGAQFLALPRLSLRANGWLFVAWLGIIDTLGWMVAGPNFGIGLAMVCTILVAIFFVGRRAGGGVLAAFGAMMLLHVFLRQHGWLAPTTTWRATLSTAALLRASLGSLGPLAVCYVGFAMIHRALFRALARLTEEREHRAAAEAARDRAEETMRANQHFEALGKLSSGVAHDVNNALTAVLCHAEFLRENLPDGDNQRSARHIVSAGRSAAQTTRQLLNLSRRAFCQPVATAPAEVVVEVGRLAGRLMPRNIRIEVTAESTGRILVDPADLQQALLNLLINGRDAMPDGGCATVEVRDLPPAPNAPVPPARRISIRVTDTGRGIPAEVLPRIFDPFFTTKPAGEGTGLGLAMVKAFVEEAGGSVAIESTVGTGTSVTLLFAATAATAPDATKIAATFVDTSGKSILLVEDDDALRGLMERVLARGGYSVTAAPTLDEALTHLSGGKTFDLLCTDGLTGATPVSAAIARFRHDRPDAPVLICSGHVTDELTGGEWLSLHLDFLRKPFTGTELLARVGEVLGRQQKREGEPSLPAG